RRSAPASEHDNQLLRNQHDDRFLGRFRKERGRGPRGGHTSVTATIPVCEAERPVSARVRGVRSGRTCRRECLREGSAARAQTPLTRSVPPRMDAAMKADLPIVYRKSAAFFAAFPY